MLYLISQNFVMFPYNFGIEKNSGQFLSFLQVPDKQYFKDIIIPP